jgi:hypothetical protein
MSTLRSAAQILDPNLPPVISVRQLAPMVFLQPPISLRRLIELASIWIRLNFVMQGQQCTNWCWAAVAVSICRYYDPNCSWTQCSLVNAELNRTDCCLAPLCRAGCNIPWYLDRALSRTGNLRSWSSGAASFTEVDQEIDAVHPIGVRIGWNGGGGHFVAIYGYHSGLSMVAVADPWGPQYSDVVYSTLVTAYLGSGSWSDTYYTEA